MKEGKDSFGLQVELVSVWILCNCEDVQMHYRIRVLSSECKLEDCQEMASDDDEVLESPDFNIARMPAYFFHHKGHLTIATTQSPLINTEIFQNRKKVAMLFRMKRTKRL